MALSFTESIGDGATKTFSFSFEYIDVDTIFVYIDGVNTSYTLSGVSQVTLAIAPADQAEVLIRRETSDTTPYTTFSRGNRFGQDNLNYSFLQQLYLMQETLDGFVPIGYYAKQDLSMGNYRIFDLADPVDDQDAATKAYVLETISGITITTEGIVTVDNIDILRTLQYTDSIKYVELLGYYNPGDSGGDPFFWNPTLTDADDDGIIIKVIGVDTGRWVRDRKGKNVSPDMFGAYKRGESDPGVGFYDDAATQAAIDYIITNGLSILEFGEGSYWFDNPVTLNIAATGLRITGKGVAGWLNPNNNIAGTRVTGSDGLTSLFDIIIDYFGLETDHVFFDARSVVTGVVSAFYSTAEGYPARPVSFHHNQFNSFEKVIHGELVPGGVPNTGWYNVHIHDNVFYAGNYALYFEGDIGSIGGLNFESNVAEQGAKIHIGDSGAFGTIRICDNLLENQDDAIYIEGGHCQAEIKRNYFEKNYGTIIHFSTSAADSSIDIGDNYYLDCSVPPVGDISRVFIQGCYANVTDNFEDLGIRTFYNLIQRKSEIKQPVFYLDTNTTGNIQNNIDISSINSQRKHPVSNGEVVVVSQSLSLIEDTPLGTKAVIPVTGTSGTYPIQGNLSIGDYVTLTFLVRAGTAQDIMVTLYDNASAYINESSPILIERSGEWSLIHIGIRALATSTGNSIIRFGGGAGLTYEIADFIAFVKVNATYLSPLYASDHQTPLRGVSTVPSLASSVVVTHGLGYIPRSVKFWPRDDFGDVWAATATINATTFTIFVDTPIVAASDIEWEVF